MTTSPAVVRLLLGWLTADLRIALYECLYASR